MVWSSPSPLKHQVVPRAKEKKILALWKLDQDVSKNNNNFINTDSNEKIIVPTFKCCYERKNILAGQWKHSQLPVNLRHLSCHGFKNVKWVTVNNVQDSQRVHVQIQYSSHLTFQDIFNWFCGEAKPFDPYVQK